MGCGPAGRPTAQHVGRPEAQVHITVQDIAPLHRQSPRPGRTDLHFLAVQVLLDGINAVHWRPFLRAQLLHQAGQLSKVLSKVFQLRRSPVASRILHVALHVVRLNSTDSSSPPLTKLLNCTPTNPCMQCVRQ